MHKLLKLVTIFRNIIPANALTDPRAGFEGQFITDPRPGFEGQFVTAPIGYSA